MQPTVRWQLVQAVRHHQAGRLFEAEGIYRDILSHDPDNSDALHLMGVIANGVRQFDLAVRLIGRSVEINPTHAAAHNNHAIALREIGSTDAAEAAIREAIRLDPGSAQYRDSLGCLLTDQMRFDEAIAAFRTALALGPADVAMTYYNVASAHFDQNRFDEASLWLNRALAIRRDFPEAHVQMARILLVRGNWNPGFKRWEWRLKTDRIREQVELPRRWKGEPVEGKTVFLHAEMGNGDSLQFVRYVPLVTALGARVLLSVPNALRRVLSCIDCAAILSEEDDFVPEYDYHASLLSLPAVFGTTVDSVPPPLPYLRGNSEPWASFLNTLPGIRCGVCWAGRARENRECLAADARRSMPLTTMLPLLTVPGVSFVSLQLGPPAAQLAQTPAGVTIHDVSSRLQDWQDTADLMAGLDLVISVDTAVCHLAGALGKPVWMLNRFDTCWRWLQERQDSPWYPTMRIYRQTRLGDWSGPIQAIADELQKLASAS